MRHCVAPDALVDLLALEDLPASLREELEELELAPGEIEVLPADEGLELIHADLDLARDKGPTLGADVGPLAPPHH